MEIRVYATLRDVVGGQSIHLDAASKITVGQMLEKLFARYPALRSRLLDEEGKLQEAIHILINGRDMRYVEGLETAISPQDMVRIFPPVGGGI